MIYAMYTEDEMEEITEFIEESFGKGEYVIHELKSEYVHTDISVCFNGQVRNFVTFGMSAATMNAPLPLYERIELVMHTTAEFNSLSSNCKTLQNELCGLSKLPFLNNTWIGIGHTIGASNKFKSTFGYDAFLLAPTDVKFKFSEDDEYESEVLFLNVIPIYDDERKWMIENDSFAYIDMLYRKFDKEIYVVDKEREHYIPKDSEYDEFKLLKEYDD